MVRSAQRGRRRGDAVAREVGFRRDAGGQPTCAASPARGRTSPTRSTRWPVRYQPRSRNIADVTTAVANGKPVQKIHRRSAGEILQLKETINTMVDQLNTFAPR